MEGRFVILATIPALRPCFSFHLDSWGIWGFLEPKPLTRIWPETTAQDNLRIIQLKRLLVFFNACDFWRYLASACEMLRIFGRWLFQPRCPRDSYTRYSGPPTQSPTHQP
ncbi:hypothetical protein BDP81DRAFT_440548 [Colletotrichum phormii]|uniref:Uncharacterized protein n=1 Tax=Colletotrichum phormii TaxID=359342 RepID=A0AAI9ZEF7_9PEZI|nr:uncharacterized protein BDP81DRAFT_440548 [Colletotrichum phormii]KAK1622946.1 hypothetical protein BDP81DRAFT_440548 [Colletotrichum phormii]